MLVGLLITVPLLASLLVFITKGNSGRTIAFGASIIEFALALITYFQFKHSPESAQLILNLSWVESLGIHFSVGVDALSLLMVLLTTGLIPLIILDEIILIQYKEHLLL